MKRLAKLLPFALLVSVALAQPATAQRPQHTFYSADTVAAVQYGQPEIYRKWWAETAECARKVLPDLVIPDSSVTAKVSFYYLPATLFVVGDYPGTDLAATWVNEPAIYVGQPYVWEEGTIRHEMLHYILALNGYEFKGFHPKELFESCGLHVFGVPHP